MFPSCWWLLACSALWHWNINLYFLDQIWHFCEAAVVLPPNDSVLSLVPHTRANPESSSVQPFHLCCELLFCEFNSLLISQFESHLARRQSQIITNSCGSSVGEQKEIIFQILIIEILEFYWRQVLRHGFTRLTAFFLFSINSSWSESRNRYPDCQLKCSH